MAESPPTSAGAVARRGAWMVADQGANSVFSLLVGFGAAWLLTADGFGLFGALFAVVLIARGVARALVLEPLQIRFAGQPGVPAGTAITGVVLLLAAMGAVVAAVGAVSGTPDWSVAAAFVVAAVLLGVSDSVRAVEVTAGRPARAMVLSVTMLVALAVGVVLLVVVDGGAAAAWLVVGAAAMCGLVAVGSGPVGSGARPGRPGAALGWMWGERHLSVPLLLDFGASAGVAHAAVVVLAAGDLGEAGALRAAMMAAGPLQFVFVALTQFLIVESARVESRRADRLGAVTAAVWAVLGGVFLLGVWLGADAVETVLGDSGPAARQVVPAAVVMTIATGPGLLASSLMRTRGLAARAARLRLILAVPLLAAVAVGVATTGATGVAWWTAAVHAASAPIWWVGLRRG